MPVCMAQRRGAANNDGFSTPRLSDSLTAADKTLPALLIRKSVSLRVTQKLKKYNTTFSVNQYITADEKTVKQHTMCHSVGPEF